MNRPPIEQFKQALKQMTEGSLLVDEFTKTIDYALYLEQKYAPRSFDPEDRGTWPEYNREVVISYYDGSRELLTIEHFSAHGDVDGFLVKISGFKVWRNTGSIRYWQYLEVQQ